MWRWLATRLESTTGTPFDPAVCLTEAKDWTRLLLVVTLADTPMLAGVDRARQPGKCVVGRIKRVTYAAQCRTGSSPPSMPRLFPTSRIQRETGGPLLVTTEAVTPIAALLIAVASVASVLLDEPTVESSAPCRCPPGSRSSRKAYPPHCESARRFQTKLPRRYPMRRRNLTRTLR